MTATQSRILIALDGGGPAPCGHLEVAGEPDRSFSGWLGLLAVLGEAVERPARPADAELRSPATGAR